jgi:hypothetical protein
LYSCSWIIHLPAVVDAAAHASISSLTGLIFLSDKSADFAACFFNSPRRAVSLA